VVPTLPVFLDLLFYAVCIKTLTKQVNAIIAEKECGMRIFHLIVQLLIQTATILFIKDVAMPKDILFLLQCCFSLRCLSL